VTLHPLWGHEGLRRSLSSSVIRDALPGALLLHGTQGSGKQRFGLWLANVMVCEALTPEGPCGACQSCRLAGRLEHPDIHWYFPLPRPKGSLSQERLAGALEDARWETLSEIREAPLNPPRSDEPQGIYLAVIQSLRRKAIQRPSMSRRQVFLIGRAEALVPQESSPEAANALLKLLEEPPDGTNFILTSSQPRRLLPTIRSRSLSLHIPPLSVPAARAFLVEVAGASGEDADRAALLSGGAIGRALGFLPEDGEPGPLEVTRKDAFRLFRAGLEGGLGSQFAAAISFPPARARTLLPLLEGLEVWVRDAAAVVAESPESVVNQDALPYLQKRLTGRELTPAQLARALASVEQARREAAGNVNPQLIIHGLIHSLRQTVGAAPQVPPIGAGRR